MKRKSTYALNGMVCCSVPQASSAGLEILRKGGNAMDAAVAAAAVLTVAEPTANGLGSDAFALIWSEKDKKLFGLNASGPAPALASRENYLHDKKDENGRMPKRGWGAVTVPGAVGAWAAIRERFGTMSLSDLVMPAVSYAEDGIVIGEGQAVKWKTLFEEYTGELTGEEFREWFRTFHPEGKAYRAGDIIKLPDHAKTLREIGRTGGESFYRGTIAEKIDEQSRRFGGYLRASDLAAYHPFWVEPIRVNYRGYEVCEIPPNGQGLVALMALNIMNHYETGLECTGNCNTCHSGSDEDTVKNFSVRDVHRQLEAMKIAFADGLHYITDPADMQVSVSSLLDPVYSAQRAAEIGERAQIFTHAEPFGSGTVYFCCADKDGNMVSYIQSNYNAFGSGIVVAGTGIALQNRGADFSLDPADANCIRPGKRTYHTIIPGFLVKDGKPVGPFGVMGAYMQPQGHVQVVMNMIDRHMDPQQALDAPRWQWLRDKTILVEPEFDPLLAASLQRLGHDIVKAQDSSSFGKGEIILRLENGAYCGGTETRFDGSIACY